MNQNKGEEKKDKEISGEEKKIVGHETAVVGVSSSASHHGPAQGLM